MLDFNKGESKKIKKHSIYTLWCFRPIKSEKDLIMSISKSLQFWLLRFLPRELCEVIESYETPLFAADLQQILSCPWNSIGYFKLWHKQTNLTLFVKSFALSQCDANKEYITIKRWNNIVFCRDGQDICQNLIDMRSFGHMVSIEFCGVHKRQFFPGPGRYRVTLINQTNNESFPRLLHVNAGKFDVYRMEFLPADVFGNLSMMNLSAFL